MNNVEEIVKAFETAGLSVRVVQRRTMLDVRTGRDGTQQFVFSPVLYQRGWMLPLDVRMCDTDSLRRMGLIQARPSNTKESVAVLVGEDERYFVAELPALVDSVEAALELLTPAEVRMALSRGVDVRRQGDWFFIPLSESQIPEVLDKWLSRSVSALWLRDHRAQKGVETRDGIFVRGDVTHREHKTLHLQGWHEAVSNQATREVRRGGTWTGAVAPKGND